MASIHLGKLVAPDGFSRLVAIKVLHPLCADDEHHRMLLDEARLSARVRHPNVVQTLDVVHEDDRVCVVMEYVHGVDLATVRDAAMELGARMPPGVASAILVGVLQGLHAAHEARREDGSALGLVHRDVSPQNVVVGVDGIARVLDFGVAKALHKDHVTAEGVVKGKVAYMAPEQLLGAVVTRQADIYAAGVVLWELLTGRRLFEDHMEVRLIGRVLTAAIHPPSELARGIAPELDAVVLRSVAREQSDRFATAQEMANALAAAAPPATNDEVAQWLEGVAVDALTERTERVREAEAFVPIAGSSGVSRRRSLRRMLLVPVTLAVAIAAMVSVRAMRSSNVASGSTGGVVSAQAPTDVAPAPLPTGPEPSAAPPLDIAPQIEIAAPAKPAAAHAGGHPPGRATRGAQCDPPYTIDANGMKHYKVACLP
jgi:serine/threonine-protein kinase